GDGVGLVVAEDAVAEVLDHEREALVEGDLGLPTEELLGAADVRLPLVRVVGGVRPELDPRVWVDGVLHHLGKLQHCELPWVSQVEWPYVLPFHQLHQPLHLHTQINVLEAPRLLTVAVHRQGLLPQCLHNKVADDPAIVDAHTGAVGVEDPSNPNLEVGATVVVHGQCLRRPLPLVVRIRTDGVDVAPVGLDLGVLERVAVDLAGAGEEEAGADALGEAEHVEGADDVGLDGLDGVVLVVHGGRRARQVVDLVHLQEDRLHDVVPDHLEVRVAGVVQHVLLPPREQVVHHHHAVAARQQPVHQVAPHEPGSPRHHHAEPLLLQPQRHARPRRRRRHAGVLPHRQPRRRQPRRAAVHHLVAASVPRRRSRQEEDQRRDGHADEREHQPLLGEQIPQRAEWWLVRRLGR
ncbi:hypothetical protein EE612_041336, partial [Oryza sativa]